MTNEEIIAALKRATPTQGSDMYDPFNLPQGNLPPAFSPWGQKETSPFNEDLFNLTQRAHRLGLTDQGMVTKPKFPSKDVIKPYSQNYLSDMGEGDYSELLPLEFQWPKETKVPAMTKRYDPYDH